MFPMIGLVTVISFNKAESTRRTDFLLTTTVTVSWSDSFLGQYIVREGTSGDTFYIISDGGVRVTKKSAGREEEIRTLARGDYFGEQVIEVLLLSSLCLPLPVCNNVGREARAAWQNIWYEPKETVWRTKLNMTAKCFLLQSHDILWVARSHGN